MNSLVFIGIGIMIGWYADRVLITLRRIAFRLRQREAEGSVVEDGVLRPTSIRTVGAVVDPLSEAELRKEEEARINRMNGL